LYRIATQTSGLPVVMPLGATVKGLFVWNFEFESLGFV
jgi:hypothetical protein